MADFRDVLRAISGPLKPDALMRVARYLTAGQVNVAEGELDPGLVQLTDGSVWLVNPDGSLTKVGGGSGGAISVTDGSTTVDPATELDFSGATVTDEGSGVAGISVGGSTPGAARWIGPYTVGFADFDPDTFAAEVMTPTAGDLFLGARFNVTEAFDAGVILSLAAGDLADGPGVYIPGISGGVAAASAATPTNGALIVPGPEVGYDQDAVTKAINTLLVIGALIESNAVAPRVYVYTNQLPTQGSASVYLSFATPEAP